MKKEKLRQIPMDYKSKAEILVLVKMLQSIGYTICHGLEDPFKCNHIVAVVVDTKEKSIHQSNVTCMSCWCNGKRKPLYVSEVIANFNRLIVKRDLKFYNSLLEKAKCDKARPMGQIFKIK